MRKGLKRIADDYVLLLSGLFITETGINESERSQIIKTLAEFAKICDSKKLKDIFFKEIEGLL
jgi:hypothetical protein